MRNLLVFTLSGTRCGVWEDAVSSLRPATTLHRLPLSPPAIAGIAILDDHSATIADLAACLGLPAMTRAAGATFLVIEGGDRISGFVVGGAVDRFPCAPAQVLPLPDALRTSVIDSCAVLTTGVVPVINVRELHGRLSQGNLDVQRPAGNPPAAGVDLSRVSSVRLFSIGGERFCVAAEGTSYREAPVDRIAAVPGTAFGIAGVMLEEGALVPVMRLEEGLGIEDRAVRKGVLIAGGAFAPCGMLVDQDLGIIGSKEFRLLALPPLVGLPWMPAAAVAGGRAFPFIEAGMLLSCLEGGDRPPQQRFTTSSGFAASFRKGDVDVTEFSLLGDRHAVPKEDVKEVHPVLPVTRIPQAPLIILGVAELQGALLPVLDLAAVFGRRSSIGRKWRMLQIANGDFQALVVTKEVAGDRHLPPDTQREVPIALPHQVLYGCYLDAGAVRLIMNVEALTVHFEKTAVRELLTSLLPEFGAQAMEAEEVAEQELPAAEKTVPAEKAAEIFGQRPATAIEERPVAAEGISVSGGDASAEEERIREEERLRAAAETAERKLAEQRVEAEKRMIEEEVRARAAELARREAGERAREEERRREEAARKQAEEDARAIAEAEERARAREEERKRAAEDAARQAAEEARKREEEETQRRREELAKAEAAEQARREAAEAAGADAVMRTLKEAEDAARKAPREAAERFSVQHEVAPGPRVTAGDGQEEQLLIERKKGRHRGIATAIAVLLVLVIYLVSTPEKKLPPEPERPAAKETPRAVEKSGPHKEAPPLTLAVPPERSVPEQTVYTVVKGDTLWGISKRFTGNPLNYPRVAKDNRIATPDLIFPGQRIRLVQEKR